MATARALECSPATGSETRRNDARGSYDPAGFHREVSEAGLDHLPVFIEVFSPFEQADDEIVPLIRSSLAACRP